MVAYYSIFGIGISLICCLIAVIIVHMALRKYKRTMSCLINLVNELNTKFPGSSLTVIETPDNVKVTGELNELRYYMFNDYE